MGDRQHPDRGLGRRQVGAASTPTRSHRRGYRSEVEAELRRGSAGITAVNLAEVIDQLIRPARRSQQDVDTSLASLVAGGLRVIPVDESIGRLAGRLRARHYDRRSAPISLGDCVALAASSVLGATLATADPPLASVAKRTGVNVLRLPDSKGKRP